MAEDLESMDRRIERRTLLLGLAAPLIAAAFSRRLSAAASQSTPVAPLDLKGWSETSRAILRKCLTGTAASGRIAAENITAIAHAEKVNVDAIMIRMLPVAKHYARPPISNFYVGAAALGASGALYLGANLEVPGNALNQSVHGEQSTVANAFAAREKSITAIAVTDAPCGHCRQFLNEIDGASRIRIIVDGQPVHTLGELLPSSFGPRDLGSTTGLLNSVSAPLELVATASDPAARAALDAASRSYAPYSKARSGCAVVTKSGRSFSGSYLENAAFNPSLSPLQSALVAAVFGGEDLAAIQRVVLVEMKGAAISQRAATEAVLTGIAPGARLDRILATK